MDVGLPIRPFLYTLDQIATLIEVNLDVVKNAYVYKDRVSPGVRPVDKLLARNIAPLGEKPDWRVAENELRRWLKNRGFVLYDTSWVRK